MATPRKAKDEPVREAVREEVRSGIGHNAPHGRAVALGRDGQPLWRHGSGNETDKYAIRDEDVPPGWVYQWKTHTIFNKEETDYQGKMRNAGWTPVMAETMPGRYMPVGHKGPIILDGLMLMETPRLLWEEAVRDEQMTAAERVNRSKAQHGLAPATTGVAVDTRGARQASFVRTARDTGLDIPRPKYDRQPID